MNSPSAITILAVEPSHLSIPYVYLSEHYTLRRVSTIMTALEKCSQKVPDLVLISSHFSVTDSLKLLETLKNRSVKKLVPIIFVVDFNQRIIILPGTTWAGQIGLLHPFSSEAEIEATVSRLLNPSAAASTETEEALMHLQAVEELPPTTSLDSTSPAPTRSSLKPLSYFVNKTKPPRSE